MSNPFKMSSIDVAASNGHAVSRVSGGPVLGYVRAGIRGGKQVYLWSETNASARDVAAWHCIGATVDFPSIAHALHAFLDPAPPAAPVASDPVMDDEEDDGCPKNDPECLGNNGDCHDACEAPATSSDPVPSDVPCYLAVAYHDGAETVLGVFRVAEHASAAEAEREAGKLCDRIRAAAPLASYGTRWKNGKGDAPAMVPQPCQPQQGQAAPNGFYAFQARGERAPHKPEPRFMGPQERDGITPKTIQAQTVQVRTRAEWYAFHHACRHLARQRMIGGRGGETFIPANICGRMHRLDVSRLSISPRIEGDKVRLVTNGSHIALKASMISARPRRALIAVELDYAAQYRRNAASEARHGNKHGRGLSIKEARASIAEARTLATNFNRLPE